jgi:outer membrane protein assembly factor BamB
VRRTGTGKRLTLACLAASLVVLSCCQAFAQPGLFPRTAARSAEVTIPEVSQATLSQLQRADKFLAEQQHADAIDTLRRTADAAGGELIAVAGQTSPKGFATYHPLAQELQRRLCALAASSPEALRVYRSQVDAEAATLLAEATRAGNEPLLRRIAANLFASSSGDDAALLSGDAALARGDVVAARRAWLQLHGSLRTSDALAGELGVYPALPWYLATRGKRLPLESDELRTALAAPAGLQFLPAHPDATASLADVRARLVVASALEGNIARAEWELDVFRQMHPNDEGRLGGRSGKYVDLLAAFLEQNRPQARSADSDWPTFAGNAARGRTASSAGTVGGMPLWSAELPLLKGDRDALGQGRARVGEHHGGLLSFHPIVYDGLAIVLDPEAMRAFDLESGEPAWTVLLREQPPPAPMTSMHVGVPRYTLTAGEGVVVAALPAAVVPSRRAPTVRREDLSRLVGVDLETRKLVFEVVADDATMIFEGTPLIERGRVYVCFRRQAEIRPQLFAACYDAASGRQLWQQLICSADSVGLGDLAEYGNSLVSLSGDTLYVNTNLGAVAALATQDGAIRWLTKYPRADFPAQKPERSDRHAFRDLNPCLIHQGQVICAPSDSDRIFSLDATSGHLVWTLPPGAAADAVHLLGVEQGYLLASGDYLYWIDVVAGQVATQFPAALPVGPGLALPTPRGAGRGVVAADRVYWPTESSLNVFALSPDRTGMFLEPKRIEQLPLTPRTSMGANLVVTGDRLLMATSDRLLGFEMLRDP